MTETGYIVGDLTPGAAYDIRVTASNTDGSVHAYVNNVNAGGPAGDTPVTTSPVNIKILPGYKEAKVHWNEVSGVYGYKIRWRTAGYHPRQLDRGRCRAKCFGDSHPHRLDVNLNYNQY